MSRPLRKGIYVPIPTFFDEIEDVDHNSLRKHVLFLAKAGSIPVVCSSYGEAANLSHEERFQVIMMARMALNENGMSDVPLIAGVNATSTRECINLALEASSAGADFAVVAAPGQYADSLSLTAIRRFFVDVAAGSPIPVVMMNCPLHANRIDIDSDLILDVLRESPNVHGVMLTDGTIGKITRVLSTVCTPDFQAKYPRKDSYAPVLVFNGHIDSLLPAASVGGAGAITLLANFIPRLCLRLWTLSQQNREGAATPAFGESCQLQSGLAEAEWIAGKHGIPGMKALLDAIYHFGAKPRRPLLPISNDEAKAMMDAASLQSAFKFEVLETMRQLKQQSS